MLGELNARFANGSPSTRLAENGVLLRQVDGLSEMDGGRPWLPCPLNTWCAMFHAQWPSSIVNDRVRHLYYKTTGGLVLDPSLVQIFCSYAGDGNSMARHCNGGYGDVGGTPCIPGCAALPRDQCCEMRGPFDCGLTASFPPRCTKGMMETQLRLAGGIANSHNEFVIDTRSIERALPDVVLAFFCIHCRDDEDDKWTIDENGDNAQARLAKARRARDAFSRDYSRVLPVIRVDFGADPVFALS